MINYIYYSSVRNSNGELSSTIFKNISLKPIFSVKQFLSTLLDLERGELLPGKAATLTQVHGCPGSIDWYQPVIGLAAGRYLARRSPFYMTRVLFLTLLDCLIASVFISVGEASSDANHPSILRQPVLLVYNLISSIVDHAPDLIYKGDHGATYSKVLNLFFLAKRKSTLPNLNLA